MCLRVTQDFGANHQGTHNIRGSEVSLGGECSQSQSRLEATEFYADVPQNSLPKSRLHCPAVAEVQPDILPLSDAQIAFPKHFIIHVVKK